MLATDVYNIAKALSSKEYSKLFAMMKKDLTLESPKKNKAFYFSDEDAINYLLVNIFSKRKK